MSRTADTITHRAALGLALCIAAGIASVAQAFLFDQPLVWLAVLVGVLVGIGAALLLTAVWDAPDRGGR
jgi:hypothetical protein